jgi:predicted dehydrogenase
MDKVKMAVVGVGGRGIGFAKMARENPNAELVAIADTNTERAKRAAANLGVSCQTYPSIEKLLESSGAEAVVVATPDYLHKQHALAVFAAGKHLLLEKPIATSVQDGLDVLKAARRSDRVLSIGFNLRHNPVVNEMKRLIVEQNAVGKPFYLTSVEFYNGGRTYMARWNRLKKYTGGLFIHKGTHDFDVLNWMNEPAHPKWVSASGGVNVLERKQIPFEVAPGTDVGPTCSVCAYGGICPDKPGYMAAKPAAGTPAQKPLFDADTAKVDGYHKDLCIYTSDKDTHDNAMAIVEYDNGSRAFHSEVFITARDNREYVVVGDKGHMEADLGARTIDIYPRWTRNKVTHTIQEVSGGHGGSDPGLLATFLRCIRTGERPLAGPVDGIWSMAVGVAAEMSREQNRVVQLSELLDPKSDLLNA